MFIPILVFARRFEEIDELTESAGVLLISLRGGQRISFQQVQRAATAQRHDYLNAYVSDLGSMLDMEAIRGATISISVDTLGGASDPGEKRLGAVITAADTVRRAGGP